MKQIYEMHGQGRSIRGIARLLGISRNTVRKYVRAPEVPKPKPRPKRGSKLDPYKEYIHNRLAEGVENCVVLLREIRERGYTGGYSLLKAYVRPFRKRRQPQATVRFETGPGEQAQVDFGRYRYLTSDGKVRWVWAFVLVLGWSRATYVEFVPRADTATFIRCHLNAFTYIGGIPRRCLYDNTKLVVLDRDEEGEPIWNEKFLDFALRLGFEIKLCRPYRARTKGKVERGVGYVEHNFWPGARFVDLDDLNRQARLWLDTVANVRLHGTTRERPVDRLRVEQAHLLPLPGPEKLVPFLREERKVGRDGYIQWQGAFYGVPWGWAGKKVDVQADQDTVKIWAGEELLAVHPRAERPGTRFTLPGQWDGLAPGDNRPRRTPTAFQVRRTDVDVAVRPLAEYEALVVSEQ